MGVARTTAVPEFCQTCQGDTPAYIELNKAGQLEAHCSRCKNVKMAGALSAPMAGTGKAVGGNDAEGAVKVLPVVPSKLADVVPLPFMTRGHGEIHLPRPAAPTRTSTTAGDIVEQARAQMAALQAEIPVLEGNLAAAKAHLRGLARMVAAYDRANPPKFTELVNTVVRVVDSTTGEVLQAGKRIDKLVESARAEPKRRMTRREARAAERHGG